MTNISQLPYRPCAGIMLVNRSGKIFVGQRLDTRTEAWQMPQGGIDEDEDAELAALRELEEETGVSRDLVTVIARTKDEHFYDLPEELVGQLWKGRWRGQRQIWFLMRFMGEDSDINIETSHQEFRAWQWVDPESVPELIVPFKEKLYRNVLAEFSELI